MLVGNKEARAFLAPSASTSVKVVCTALLGQMSGANEQ